MVGAGAPDLLPVDDPHLTVADAAVVVNPARSDPLPGSLKSWHQLSSPVTILGRSRRFSADEPCARMVGAARSIPDPSGVPTAPVASSTSLTRSSATREVRARSTPLARWARRTCRRGGRGARPTTRAPGPVRLDPPLHFFPDSCLQHLVRHLNGTISRICSVMDWQLSPDKERSPSPVVD